MQPRATYEAGQVLPQSGRMVLLDAVLSFSDDSLVASVDLAKPSAFHGAGGRVPGFVGIEYMVQAIAALAGIREHRRGLKPRVGLLLGSRSVEVKVPWFPERGVLKVSIEQIMMYKGIAVFDGQVNLGAETLVTGRNKALQPESKARLNNILEQT